MRRKHIPVLCAAAVLVLVCGCANLNIGGGGSNAGTAAAPSAAPGLAPNKVLPIPDLPIPAGFQLVDKESGNWDAYGGVRLVDHLYKGREEKLEVRKFYEDQMPTYQWQLVSATFTQGSFFLSFQKDNERCLILIGDGGWYHKTHVRARIHSMGTASSLRSAPPKRVRPSTP